MKAVFLNQALPLIARAVKKSKDINSLRENIKYNGTTDEIEYSRYGWIRVEKNDESLEFASQMSMVSSGMGIVHKGVYITEKSIFVSLSVIDVYNSIVEKPIDVTKIIAIDEEQAEEAMEMLIRNLSMSKLDNDGGDDSFLLMGSMSVDSWRLLEEIGTVCTRNVPMDENTSTTIIPGFCIVFGGAIVALERFKSKKIPKHITEDFESIFKDKDNESN